MAGVKQVNKELINQANQRFYDQIAQIYDFTDVRRLHNDTNWIASILARCQKYLEKSFKNEELIFLDAGTGSGHLANVAARFFPELILVDISEKMLEKNENKKAKKIVADCTDIPLQSSSVHMIGAFATLHHLYSIKDFFMEAHRLLKRGGIVYTDHDIEKSFVKNFDLPLRLYRFFFDHGDHYIHKCPEAKFEDYKLSEFHAESGVDSYQLKNDLEEMGFEILKFEFHYEGMGAPHRILNKLHLLNLFSKEGFAPILRVVAKKK